MRRSLLFLPGNSPSMIMNGTVLPSDSIILDLEDAVAIEQKDAARDLIQQALQFLTFPNKEIIIRINALDSEFWQEDLEKIVPHQPDVIMLPKSQTVAQIEQIDAALTKIEREHQIEVGSTKVLPLIETALGVENAFFLGKSSVRIVGLFLGAEDLTADLQCERTKKGDEIFYARARLINAARACGIEVYDTPFTDVQDHAGLREDALFAKRLGFSGKAAISPHHIQQINQIFSPSEAEIEYAKEVLAVIEQAQKEGKGAVSLHGKMIDKPIVLRAQRTLAMAEQIDR